MGLREKQILLAREIILVSRAMEFMLLTADPTLLEHKSILLLNNLLLLVFLRNIDLKGATGIDSFRAGPFTRYLLVLSASEIEGSDEVFFALKVASAGTSKFASVLVDPSADGWRP